MTTEPAQSYLDNWEHPECPPNTAHKTLLEAVRCQRDVAQGRELAARKALTVPDSRYELHDDILYERVDHCTCGQPHSPYGHEPGCGQEPLGPVEQMLDKAAAMAKVEELFADGGPDTPIRTTWHDGVEHWEVPAYDMLTAMGVTVKPGCCSVCSGTGSAPDGPCSDCYGTGHPHPADSSCRPRFLSEEEQR